VKQQLRLVLIALQFFTRLPLPESLMQRVGFEAEWISRCVRFFPLVGFLVGATVAGCFLVLTYWLPQPVAIALALSLGVWMTGAFHEDGFADYCDGFGGHHSAKRTIEIMRDSRIGVYGALGLILLFAVKFAALSSVSTATAVLALLLAHPLSRACAVLVMWRLPYVEDQFGDKHAVKPVARQLRSSEIGVALGSALTLSISSIWLIPVLPITTLVVGLMLMSLATVSMINQLRRRLGGYTGDTLGAIQQITETLFFIAVTGQYVSLN
jgi:adenosylcobinamide-GDP ribazoletransferase